MKKIIILGFAITVAIVCAAGYEEIITAARGSSADYSIQPVPDLDENDPDLYDSEAPTHVPDEIIVKFKKPIADIIEDGILAGEQLRDLKLSDSLNELHKRYQLRDAKALFKNFKKKRQQTKALLQKDKASLTKKEKHILRRLKRAPKGIKVPDLDRIYKLEFDLETGQSLKELLAAYNDDPDVEYAELNYFVWGCKDPNDALYSIQWPLNNIGQLYPESGRYNHPPGTAGADINAPNAWDIHTGSSEIIVAVIDTGVDYAHRDIQANMWVNSGEIAGNGLDDDDNGYIDDIYGYDFYNDDHDPLDDDGHGTHCAGIIAAAGNNSTDITGVCWNARIMALKFLGVDTMGTMADSIEAFYYAVENGADVISNSWGSPVPFEPLKEVFEYVSSQGVINVFAAGNWGSPRPYYPAYYDHVIAVAATNSNDEKPSFSTYGPWVEIAAPGVDILSLSASGRRRRKSEPYEYTTIMSGTSMACPHVAGACALMLSLYPVLDVNEVTDLLQQSADPVIPEVRGLPVCASGRLNLYEALQAMGLEDKTIFFDRDFYSCCDTVQITVKDWDLTGSGSQEVTIESDSSDLETVDLMETSPPSAIFSGTISTDSGQTNIEDGVLQVSHGSVITVTYYDANDDTGNPAIVTDTAAIDCQAPIVTNVLFDEYPQGLQLTITFETDEPTTACILCGLTRKRLYTAQCDDTLATYHTIQLDDDMMQSDCTNYFAIEVNDIVGNSTTDDNNGKCYTFTPTPYRIANVNDLLVLGDTTADYDKCFVLTADINLTGLTFTQAPIAPDTSSSPGFQGTAFTGVFDGNGFKIINLAIDTAGTGNDYLGLFGYIDSGGTVKNLGVEDVNITGGYDSWYLGGLCGWNSGIISDCFSTGSFTGGNKSRYLGGLVGENRGTISDCFSTGRVTGANYSRCLGGLVGENYGTISDCFSTGQVTGGNECRRLGGLVGVNRNGTISGCFSTGQVNGGNEPIHLGGLAGANFGIISNCYSTGSATGGDKSEDIGGLVGENAGTNRTISNCFSTGSVTGGYKSIRLGGLVGRNRYGATINNCFWDVNTSGMNTSAGGIGKTTEEMQLQSTFTDAGWDFVGETINGTNDIWYIYEGLDYPRLRWEMSIEPVDLVIELSESIDTMNLHKGIANGLQSKLDTALRLLEDGNDNNDVTSVNILQAFINALEAQRGKKIPQSDADVLITAAQEIIELLSN